jgi:hypothetical protein
LASGGSFPTGAGDASENFRPKCDFGDAPASYDPVATSPAVHERFDSLRLGLTWDREWIKTSSAGASADGIDEDGISTVPLLDTGTFNYAIDVDVYNNSGADATVSAWLDYDGNGVYDASEGVTTTVTSSASMQTVTLVWWSINTPLTIGQTTYLRVRITSASKGMGTANPTGYYDVGEVEDYEVVVDRVLPVDLISFEVKLTGDNSVRLDWKTENEMNIGRYEIERSESGSAWEKTGTVAARNQSGLQLYSYTDSLPPAGKSHYRIRIINKADDRTEKYSTTRTIFIPAKFYVQIVPNPATAKTKVIVNVMNDQGATLKIINMAGVPVESIALNLRKGRNEILLDKLSVYLPGTYIIKINAADGELIKRLVVEKK